MALSKGEKTAIVEKFATQPGDTGSSEVQVAVLTHRINQLNEKQAVHEKEDARVHAEFMALKDDVREMKADVKTLLRRSTDQIKK